MRQSVLKLSNTSKSFCQGKEELHVLESVSLGIEAGEVVALVGPSGCGKSTLLQIAGLLDNPDSGDILIDGQNCNNISDKKRTSIRLEKIGFVYQFHHLLPDFSAQENVAIPQIIANIKKKEALKNAGELLSKMGLGERLKHRPSELSGGEQQRVAIARALSNNPVILLADEPTGNLDPDTAQEIFNILFEQVRGNTGGNKTKQNLSMLFVTHDHDLARKADKILELRDLSAA